MEAAKGHVQYTIYLHMKIHNATHHQWVHSRAVKAKTKHEKKLMRPSVGMEVTPGEESQRNRARSLSFIKDTASGRKYSKMECLFNPGCYVASFDEIVYN